MLCNSMAAKVFSLIYYLTLQGVIKFKKTGESVKNSFYLWRLNK